MGSPLIKDTFREIRKTRGRFFSIFAIVGIGVAFFAGVLASAPTMRYNADLYFDEYNLMDYRILSNFGITEEDVAEIRKIDGVEGVMPAYSTDVLVSVGDAESVVRIHSLDLEHLDPNDPQYLNQLHVVEGRLPEKSGECVIEKGKVVENSLEIGDTIMLRSGTDEAIEDSFSTMQYTVVGKVETPYYLSYEKGSSTIGGGTVNLFAYVPMEDFDMEVYTEVYVTVSDAKALNSYSDQYFDYIEPGTSELETLGIDRSEIRREEILGEAQSQYDEGKQEYDEALAEFNEEIKKAEEELEDGKLEILSGEITLQNNKDLAQLQFDNAQKEIDDGKEQVAMLKEQSAEAEKAYQENNAEAIQQREENAAKLEEAKVVEAEKKKQLDQANAELAPLQAAANQIESKEAENERLTNENASLSQEIEELKAKNEQLEEEKGEPDANIEQIDAEIHQNNLQIEEKQNQITKNDALIQSNEAAIADLKKQYPNLQEDLELAVSEQAQAQREYDAAVEETARYQSTVEMIDRGLSSARQILDTLNAQIATSEKQIAEGEKELAEGKATAAEEFAKADKELAQAKLDLENGKKELEEKRAEGEEQLEEAREELVKAENEINQIEEAKWYVLDRNSHYSYVDYRGATERMEAIAKVFPVFFFLVAALVCLTTMTRMVDEQRTQIGTMKALGYSTAKIAFKYVFYAAFASLTGSAVGLAIGIFAFPAIIYTAWNMMYILPSIRFTTHVSLMLLSTGVSVLVTTLAAFSACYKELVETPALLMRPKAPKIGKKILLERITFLWERFSFTSKVTARNIFRYKKRFFMTVVGISGCTALLIAGFGIKDSISTIVEMQFEGIFQYDGTAVLKDGLRDDRKTEIIDELKATDQIDDVLDVYSANTTVYSDKEEIEATLTVIKDTERFAEFVDLHSRVDKTPLKLTSSGVIITEHMANQLGVKSGDEIEVVNEDGIRKTVKIDGIAENYVGHYVYMTSSGYKNTFDLRASTNSLLIQVNEAYSQDDSASAQVITAFEEVETLSFFTSIRNNFRDMIQSLDFIVVVLIISAGALAFVVLYNLTNVNISERLREIATLKVLGFHDREVNAYVYKENIILTLIGALAGIYLGKLLHLTIMVVVELDTIMFGRNIELFSYFISVIITLLFAVIVNQAMKKKLKAIPMVESLKSVE